MSTMAFLMISGRIELSSLYYFQSIRSGQSLFNPIYLSQSENICSKSAINKLKRHPSKLFHRPEVLCKKGVFKNFAKFRAKHLYWSLF